MYITSVYYLSFPTPCRGCFQRLHPDPKFDVSWQTVPACFGEGQMLNEPNAVRRPFESQSRIMAPYSWYKLLPIFCTLLRRKEASGRRTRFQRVELCGMPCNRSLRIGNRCNMTSKFKLRAGKLRDVQSNFLLLQVGHLIATFPTLICIMRTILTITFLCIVKILNSLVTVSVCFAASWILWRSRTLSPLVLEAPIWHCWVRVYC